LRLADVQPPKTVTTLVLLDQLLRLLREHRRIGCAVLDDRHDLFAEHAALALIWSIASSVAFLTVTSLIAIVPVSDCTDRPCRQPPMHRAVATIPNSGRRAK
jgi:hypothetical protein